LSKHWKNCSRPQIARSPPGRLGPPFLGETRSFLSDPFRFVLSRTRAHGGVWKTRLLGDTVVFFAGPEPFSFFVDPEILEHRDTRDLKEITLSYTFFKLGEAAVETAAGPAS
jgi:hypothetical protein